MPPLEQNIYFIVFMTFNGISRVWFGMEKRGFDLKRGTV